MKEYNSYEDLDDLEDWDDEEAVVMSSEGEQFAFELLDLIQSLIDTRDIIMEEFTTYNNMVRRFNKHCVGGVDENKQGELYTFETVKQYSAREAKITAAARKLSSRSTQVISDVVLEYENVLVAFQQLISTPCTIRFNTSCGFHNQTEHVALLFNSFATNYVEGNIPAVDIVVYSPRYRAVAMYPIAISKLCKKFNNLITKHSDVDNINPFKF